MWNWSENQMTIVLIRHGETKENKEGRYLGKTDASLSKEGESKLERYKNLHLFPRLDFLFSSPMKRCVQTAKILYPKQACIQIKEWEEMDFGAFEGKNYIELQGNQQYQEWLDSNGRLPFPGGESREEFIARCDIGFQKMLRKVMPLKGGNVTVGMIVHGGTIMALLSKYGTGEYFDYQVANGKGYVCIVKNFTTKPQIVELKKIW